MKGIIAFEKINGLPDDLLDEARLEDPAAVKAQKKQERREARQRLFSSPAFAVAVSLVVAFGVVTGIVLAGRAAGRQPVDPGDRTDPHSESLLITYYQWLLDTPPENELKNITSGAYTDGLNTIVADPTAFRAFVRDEKNLKPVSKPRHPDLKHIGKDPWQLYQTIWLDLDGEFWRAEFVGDDAYLVHTGSMYGTGDTFRLTEEGCQLIRELLYGSYNSLYSYRIGERELYQENGMGMYGTYLYTGPDSMPDVDYPDIETEYVRVPYLFDLKDVTAEYHDDGAVRGSVTLRLWPADERNATATVIMDTPSLPETAPAYGWKTVFLKPFEWKEVTFDFDLPAQDGRPWYLNFKTGGQSFTLRLDPGTEPTGWSGIMEWKKYGDLTDPDGFPTHSAPESIGWPGMEGITVKLHPGIETASSLHAYLSWIGVEGDGQTVTVWSVLSPQNAYFCDLTGDGVPELCVTGLLYDENVRLPVSIMIYDAVTEKQYILSDDTGCRYALYMDNGCLYAAHSLTPQLHDKIVPSPLISAPYTAGTLFVTPDGELALRDTFTVDDGSGVP